MKIEVYKYPLGRKVYRRKSLKEQTVFNLYCFACGFIIAMMILVFLKYR